MHIRIANKIRITNPTSQLREFLIDNLRVVNPKYKSAVDMGFRAFGIPPYLFNFELLPDGSIDIPRGLRRNVLQWVKDKVLGIPEDVVVTDERIRLDYQHIDSRHINLREYQKKALVDLMEGGPEGLLISKAGSGKTVMGLSMLPMLGQKMLWCTHTTPLVNQVIERIATFLPDLVGGDIGIIGSGKWEIGNKFTVATIQTLVRRPAQLFDMKDEFGIVIVDECHHVPASTFLQVIGSLNPYFLYGLTATPIRKDGLSNLMVQTMGPVTASVPVEAINKSGGIIVPSVICRPLTYKTDLTDDEGMYGKILKILQENPERNALIVKDILAELSAKNICIVVTERRAHAEELLRLIKNKHKNVGIATGEYSPKVNAATLAALAAGELDCLVTTSSLLGEGFDEPKVNRVFLCLPIRNEVRTEQIVGRVQRPSPATNKVDALIYDYIDNHSLLQHQFRNKGDKGCRYNVYVRLGCKVV